MLDPNQNNAQSIIQQLPNLGIISSVPITFIQKAVKIVFFIFLLLFITGLIVVFTLSLDTTVKAKGVLEPKVIIQLRTNQSGIIQRVNTSTGAIVQTGQMIAQLDSLSFESQLVKIETDYRSKKLDYQKIKKGIDFQRQQEIEQLSDAKARLIKARAQYRNSLVQYGYNTDNDSFTVHYKIGTHIGIDIAMSDVVSAEALVRYHTSKFEEIDLDRMNIQKEFLELQELKKQLTILQKQRHHLTIVSPISGIVLTERVDQLVTSFVHEGYPLIEIGALGQWRADLYVNEQGICDIQNGDSAQIEIKALPSMDYGFIPGRVTSIASEPTIAEGKVDLKFDGLYRVTIDIDLSNLNSIIQNKLRRGYNVEGNIKTGSRRIIDFIFKIIKN